MPGSDGVSFITQGTQFKLFDQFKTVLSYDMVTVPLFKALGDKVVGFYGNVGYDVNADNAKNQAFVEGLHQEVRRARPTPSRPTTTSRRRCCSRRSRRPSSVDPAKVKAALAGLQLRLDRRAGEGRPTTTS